MTPGKEICRELKELREQIAKENGTLSMVFIIPPHAYNLSPQMGMEKR